MPANWENSSVATGLEKISFHFNPKGNAKERSNYRTIALISHASKVKVKSLSHVQLLATPWTAAYQAPQSMGFSRQEYWSGLPLPSPGIPFELFQILKDDAMKVLHSIRQQIWKSQQWPQDWKRSVFIPIPKKGNAKKCSNYHTIALISHASKVMLKILQARLQQYVNCGLPDVQAGFRKGRGTRGQIANICWIMEKAREFQKKHLFLLY